MHTSVCQNCHSISYCACIPLGHMVKTIPEWMQSDLKPPFNNCSPTRTYLVYTSQKLDPHNCRQECNRCSDPTVVLSGARASISRLTRWLKTIGSTADGKVGLSVYSHILSSVSFNYRHFPNSSRHRYMECLRLANTLYTVNHTVGKKTSRFSACKIAWEWLSTVDHKKPRSHGVCC